MRTILIAHRGAQAIVPENTLEAFQLALKNKFRALECDVQLTADGKLVIIHDETLNRTVSTKGWVERSTYEHIRSLNPAVPLLHQVVDLVTARKCRLIIEIKADSETHAVATSRALATYYRSLPSAKKRLLEIHSFWYQALSDFKKRSPSATTAAIINGGFSAQQVVELANSCQANGVNLGYEFISKSEVKQCHRAGLFVDTWAVSDGTVMRRLRPFGLNGIIENFTGKIIR